MTTDQSPRVVKSNALVEAAYTLTLAEQKIILSAISQVRRDEKITDDVLYTVTANALSEMSGFKAKHEYRALKHAVDKLFDRTVTVNEKPNGDGRARIRKFRWVQEAVYLGDQGAIQLRFSKPIVPYLNQLTSEFTQYKLLHVAGMKSSYGIRLYELLVQWRSTGEREVSLDWLRQQWELAGKYPSIKDLKQRVLEPAVNDVNNHSDLWVEWGQRKTGRRVTHIQFQFGLKNETPKKTKSTGGGKKINGVLVSEIEKHARRGESYEQAAARLKQQKMTVNFS